MGLDMYLEARRSVWAGWAGFGSDKDQQIANSIRELVPESQLLTVSGITFEAAYWRKANSIHQWFVNNVQDGKDDCDYYSVSDAQLSDLANICDQVLTDRDRADELLPTSSGFFFGSTEYSDYYFSQLEYTRDRIRQLLNDERCSQLSFYYHSSW